MQKQVSNPAKPLLYRKEAHMIQDIEGQLPELYKLKIGGKGEKRTAKTGREYQLPQKWDHMKICKVERDGTDNFIVDEELTRELGDGSDTPKTIGPIMFLYNRLENNLFTAYRCYKGQTCVCRGDGVKAVRMKTVKQGEEWVLQPGTETEVECGETCPMLTSDPPACKPNGILSFMFPGAELGGVCKFRTTSWNSVKVLLGGLKYFTRLSLGRLMGIPFYLRLNEKTSQVKGKPQKIYYVSLEFKGKFEDLRQVAIEYAQGAAEHLAIVENVDVEARAKLAIDAEIVVSEDPDEFYPTVEEREDGSVVDTETKELVEAPATEVKKPKFPMKGKKGKAADEPEVDEGPEGPEETEAPEEGPEETPEEEVPGQEVLLC